MGDWYPMCVCPDPEPDYDGSMDKAWETQEQNRRPLIHGIKKHLRFSCYFY